mmetsp:Transcript_84785/g.224654  ORF Transcript_84785/g.224654 Transcript_84785/m.224654 type:complete len:217 (-) Transcript_84785:74-724(-)
MTPRAQLSWKQRLSAKGPREKKKGAAVARGAAPAVLEPTAAAAGVEPVQQDGSPTAQAEESEAADREMKDTDARAEAALRLASEQGKLVEEDEQGEEDDIAARAEAALRLAREQEELFQSQADEFLNYTPRAVNEMPAEFHAPATPRDASDAVREAELELQRILEEAQAAEKAAAAKRSLTSAGGELQRKLRLRQEASEAEGSVFMTPRQGYTPRQ